jgi:hypothetical protein
LQRIAHKSDVIGLISASSPGMETSTNSPAESDIAPKPICVGLTCWLWEMRKPKAILELAQKMGVTVQLTQKVHGLRREIEAQVSGQNVDRFIGEFVRNC